LTSGASPFGYLSRLSLHRKRIFLLPSLVRLDELFHPFAHPSLLRHSISGHTGTGISTSFPSATPLGLTLGPDLPRADEPSSGNLRLSTDRILTYLLATHTGILTSNRSTNPSGLASSLLERSPTTLDLSRIRSFGRSFSPGTFSAQSHSTSELLRTL
jgi:hypothetical protein